MIMFDSEWIAISIQVIRLSCPKAGQKSKITIKDGKLIFDWTVDQ